MSAFISAFIGAVVGIITAHILFKVFHKDVINVMPNTEEVLKELDEIDRKYTQEKVNTIMNNILYYENNISKFNSLSIDKLKRIKEKLLAYSSYLLYDDIVNDIIELKKINEMSGRILNLTQICENCCKLKSN